MGISHSAQAPQEAKGHSVLEAMSSDTGQLGQTSAEIPEGPKILPAENPVTRCLCPTKRDNFPEAVDPVWG